MNAPQLWLIPLLPLAGFLANGLFRLPRAAAAAVGCAGPIASFALSVWAAFACRGGDLRGSAFSWIESGGVSVPFDLVVDPLSAVMILVVTGIGSLIHVYSISYMHEDEGFSRFFAYLNLFMFSMLVLVLGDSILLLFVGWEGVGLCSYLLIGFWYKDLKNADAGKKAFITNRVGDLGFLLGMFCLWQMFGTLNFAEMSAKPVQAGGWGLAAGLLLFLGATGKSAQIPLYVWLPDAMAGPTPVSALIHAATMVTAGVYMMGRMHFLFADAPEAVLHTVGWIAALTAFLAGVIAVAQNDIKKVLAYSTVSQLGFMFAGMSSGQFTTGLFHVVTHAFFKALLFLGAGAVIHALHGEQDIRKMGGLGRRLPALAAIFVIGGLALAGMPGLAGFFSKDAILAAVLEKGMPGPFVLLLLTAFLTAFYTARLCVAVFWPREEAAPASDPHGARETPHALHPPGPLMMGPLVVLAVLSVVGGFALAGPLESSLGRVWKTEARIDDLVLEARSGPEDDRMAAAFHLGRLGDPALAKAKAGGLTGEHLKAVELGVHDSHRTHLLMMGVSALIFVAGAGGGFLLFTRGRERLARLVEGPLAPLHRLASNKFYVDEIYEFLVIAPLRMGALLAWFVVDRVIIDTICVTGSARAVYAVGWVLRKSHTGSLNASLLCFVLGALGALAWLAFTYGNAWKSPS
jgi:NADH-quinone oxidoreductase subunit L